MWINLAPNSPFSYGLRTQQQFKVIHVDFGTAHDSRDAHISSRYFVNKTSAVQLPLPCASPKSASLILLSKSLFVVSRVLQKRATKDKLNNKELLELQVKWKPTRNQKK